MALKICPVCQGTKKIRSLGMMSGECDFCEGIGKVEPEKLSSAPVIGAAKPLQRDALPDDYYDQQRKQVKMNCVDSNYGFKNKLNDRNIPGKAPKDDKTAPPTEAKLAEIRAKTVARDDDLMNAQKPELSPSLKAELEALEKARVVAELEGAANVKGKGKAKQAQG